MSTDEAEFRELMDDLERCDGYAPCGDCDRCTPGGRPWREARDRWLEDPADRRVPQ